MKSHTLYYHLKKNEHSIFSKLTSFEKSTGIKD